MLKLWFPMPATNDINTFGASKPLASRTTNSEHHAFKHCISILVEITRQCWIEPRDTYGISFADVQYGISISTSFQKDNLQLAPATFLMPVG